MLDTNFFLDGVSAKTKGIYSGKPVSFSPAVPKIKSVQIPGKSGDLQIDEGGYYNRTATVPCFTLTTTSTAMVDMKTAAAWLLSSRGYRKLQTKEDTTHFWYASIKNTAEIAPRLNLLNPFTIEWDCKPYAYLTGYDEKITIAASGNVVVNPTFFEAYPILYVIGSANGQIAFPNGGITLTGAVSTEIAIDCEAQRAYDPLTGTSKDNLISATEFPYFVGGNNAVTFSGITSLKYIPRFREIL